MVNQNNPASPASNRQPTHILRVERRRSFIRRADDGSRVKVWTDPWPNDIKFIGTHVEAVDAAAILMGKENVRAVSIFTVGA